MVDSDLEVHARHLGRLGGCRQDALFGDVHIVHVGRQQRFTGGDVQNVNVPERYCLVGVEHEDTGPAPASPLYVDAVQFSGKMASIALHCNGYVERYACGEVRLWHRRDPDGTHRVVSSSARHLRCD